MANTGTNPVLFETLTPENAALLLIDHQVGTMNFGLADTDGLRLKNQTLWLAEVSKVFKLPVFLSTSNVNGENGPLFPELLEILPDAPVINRVIINAWADPAFTALVKATGRKKLIMAAVTTDVCLTFPAISAVGEGYDVYAVLDASGTVNAHALQAAIARMSQAGVKMANANMVVAELLANWATEYGEPLGKLYSKYLSNFGFIAAHLAYQAKRRP